MSGYTWPTTLHAPPLRVTRHATERFAERFTLADATRAGHTLFAVARNARFWRPCHTDDHALYLGTLRHATGDHEGVGIVVRWLPEERLLIVKTVETVRGALGMGGVQWRDD